MTQPKNPSYFDTFALTNTPAKKNVIISIIISFIVFLTFRSILSFGFIVMDDPAHLLENTNVLSLQWSDIVGIFQSNVFGHYLPLTILTYAVEHHFFQFDPFIYHFNNLLLHIGVVILIFFFGRNLGLSMTGSAFAALIFGVHPMHVESVVWITERKDVLYSFFYMMSLNAYLQYLLKGSRNHYIASILFGFLSILSKPMAYSLPLILLLCDWFKKREFNSKMIIDKIPYFLYIIPVSLISFVSLHKLFRAESLIIESVLLAIRNFMFYLYKFMLPIDLTPLYYYKPQVFLTNPEFVLSVAAFGILVIVLFKVKNSRWLYFALSFFVLSMLMMLHQDDRTYITTIADRRMYLPSLGICLWAGYLIEQLIRKSSSKTIYKGSLFIILAAFSLTLCFMSVKQSAVWKDDDSYWTHVLRITPENPLAFFARGKNLEKQGDYPGAIHYYTKAIELDPQRYHSFNNRGIVYALTGHYELAENDFNRAVAIDPEYAKTYNNRGRLNELLGDHSSALRDYSVAIQLDPEEASTYLNRSNCYYQLKLYGKALKDAERAKKFGIKGLNDYINELRALLKALNQ